MRYLNTFQHEFILNMTESLLQNNNENIQNNENSFELKEYKYFGEIIENILININSSNITEQISKNILLISEMLGYQLGINLVFGEEARIIENSMSRITTQIAEIGEIFEINGRYSGILNIKTGENDLSIENNNPGEMILSLIEISPKIYIWNSEGNNIKSEIVSFNIYTTTQSNITENTSLSTRETLNKLKVIDIESQIRLSFNLSNLSEDIEDWGILVCKYFNEQKGEFESDGVRVEKSNKEENEIICISQHLSDFVVVKDTSDILNDANFEESSDIGALDNYAFYKSTSIYIYIYILVFWFTICFTLFCIGLYFWGFYTDRGQFKRQETIVSRTNKYSKQGSTPNISEESKTDNYIEEISYSDDDDPEKFSENKNELKEESKQIDKTKKKKGKKLRFKKEIIRTETEGSLNQSELDLKSKISDSTLSDVNKIIINLI